MGWPKAGMRQPYLPEAWARPQMHGQAGGSEPGTKFGKRDQFFVLSELMRGLINTTRASRQLIPGVFPLLLAGRGLQLYAGCGGPGWNAQASPLGHVEGVQWSLDDI